MTTGRQLGQQTRCECHVRVLSTNPIEADLGEGRTADNRGLPASIEEIMPDTENESKPPESLYSPTCPSKDVQCSRRRGNELVGAVGGPYPWDMFLCLPEGSMLDF